MAVGECYACVGPSGKGACRQAATLHWSGLRFAPTALALALASGRACARRKTVRRVCFSSGRTASRSWPRRQTRSIRCAHCAQTAATSQSTMRAARVATSPALLGAPEARRNLPARAFVQTSVPFAGKADVGGLRGGRCPAGAIWVTTSSAGPGSARASALRCLTRRRCLNAANAVSEVSLATRPRTEQRSAVDAQRRPPPHEPAPRSACRDALNGRMQSMPRNDSSGPTPESLTSTGCDTTRRPGHASSRRVCSRCWPHGASRCAG